MIHYHGTPITPAAAAVAVLTNGHAFVSFAHPQQLEIAISVCQTFSVDNGAFSAWRGGDPITNWEPYYQWVASLHRVPNFSFACIPDVIDGGEDENDKLLEEWPWKTSSIGAPIWHLHESLERLLRLALNYPRICLGSSGEYAKIGTPPWHTRMAEAMNTICDKNGLPICKLHGLRMASAKIQIFPFSSVDSCNIGINIGMDKNWYGSYLPHNKTVRAIVMRERIESTTGARFWEHQATQK